MADRSDLWGPSVRKWMTEWHSPVAGFTLGKQRRGGLVFGVPQKARIVDVVASPARIVDIGGDFRVVD